MGIKYSTKRKVSKKERRGRKDRKKRKVCSMEARNLIGEMELFKPFSRDITQNRLKKIGQVHLISIRMTTIEKTLEITSVGEDVEKLGPSCTAGGNAKSCSQENSMEAPQRN